MNGLCVCEKKGAAMDAFRLQVCGVGAGVNECLCVCDKRGSAMDALRLQVCGVGAGVNECVFVRKRCRSRCFTVAELWCRCRC